METERIDLKTLADTPIGEIPKELHRRVAVALTKSYCAITEAVFQRKVLENVDAADEFAQLLHIRFAQFGTLSPRQWKGAISNGASLALQRSEGGYISFTIAEIIESLHTIERIRKGLDEHGVPLLQAGKSEAERLADENWQGDPQSAFIRNASEWIADESQQAITFMRGVPPAVTEWFKGFWKSNPELYATARKVAMKQFAVSAYDVHHGLNVSVEDFWNGSEFLQVEFDNQVKARIAKRGQRIMDYHIPNWSLFWSNALVFAYMEHLNETQLTEPKQPATTAGLAKIVTKLEDVE